MWLDGHAGALPFTLAGCRRRPITENMAHSRRHVVALSILVAIAAGSPLPASPEAWDASVLWAREDRAYIALAESSAVVPGTRLTFVEGGATIATGEVTSAHEGQLVVVAITSGSLERARSLAAVRITAEPPRIERMRLLRIGYPAPGRPNLLFDCDRVTPRPPGPADLYRVDALSDRSFRFVRNPAAAPDGPWPDTLLVRLFEVAADEEIALERGDLDAAVFWPGEPSPHIRAHTSWKGDLAGSLEGGVLAALHTPEVAAQAITSPSGSAGRALRAMNGDIFRGDLSPCGPDPDGTLSDSAAAGTAPPLRFEVSRDIPGWQAMERRLNESLPANGARPSSIRLQRVRGWGSSPEERGGTARTRDEGNAGVCVFEIRCPILSTPKVRTYLTALGPDALVRLFTCSRSDGGP